MQRNVLVPVDGSDNSWTAFDHALAEHPDEKLTILHVIDPMRGDYEPDEAETRAVKRSETVEREARERLDAAGIDDTTILVREGNPADEIIAAANADEIDQVVMGSRGLSGVKRLLLGSVAETVVRRAEVPVNIVR